MLYIACIHPSIGIFIVSVALASSCSSLCHLRSFIRLEWATVSANPCPAESVQSHSESHAQASGPESDPHQLFA
jgi:hypothetical protein